MNAAKFRDAVESAAKHAREFEPTDRHQRAVSFIAYLCGTLKDDEPKLRDVVWALLDIPADFVVSATPPSEAAK